MDIPFDTTEWEDDDLHSPWTPQPASSGVRHSVAGGSNIRLTVVLKKLASHQAAHSATRLVFDADQPPTDRGLNYVVVGKQKGPAEGFPMQRHYVLLIGQDSKTGTYERIGVGIMPLECINRSEPGQKAAIS